jgi:hypothetical protein
MIKGVIFFALFTLLAGVSSCKQSSKTKQKDYIDVAGFLKGQLRYLDTVPHGYIKVNDSDTTKPDTVYLTLQQVKELALDFIVPELEIEEFEQRFLETSFADATIQSITITYQSVSKKNTVERVDIYVNPQNGTINRLYMVRVVAMNGKPARKQLLWNYNQGFSIITTLPGAGDADSTTTEHIIWQ